MLARLFNLLRRYLGIEAGRVLRRPLDTKKPPAAPDDLRFVVMDEAQLLPYCEDPELDLRADRVRASFARGEVCIGALDGERLAGYHWYALGAAPHSEDVWVRVGSGCAYSYKKFVHPAYRGRRVALGVNASPQTLGVSHSMSFIHFDNVPSWRSASRGGSRVLGYAGFWRIGRWFFAFATPGAKRAGFAFFSRGATAAAPFPRPAPASRG